jgi:uncharacterized protein (DUF302 family)
MGLRFSTTQMRRFLTLDYSTSAGASSIERRHVMKIWEFLVFIVGFVPQTSVGGDPIKKKNGIVDVPSTHSVDETVEKVKDILQSKGITLFALIDHSGEAEKVGMKMPPTKLLIFGNPKGGTPLMLAAPSVAIDLPLKILVWEDGEGKVRLSYNSPEYLQERHGLPKDLLQNIAVVATLAAKAGE